MYKRQWVASSHMLRNRALAPTEVPAVLERSIEKFTDYHVQTLRSVMQGAAQIVPPASAAQQQLLEAVDACFAKKQAAARPWAG